MSSFDLYKLLLSVCLLLSLATFTIIKTLKRPINIAKKQSLEMSARRRLQAKDFGKGHTLTPWPPGIQVNKPMSGFVQP